MSVLWDTPTVSKKESDLKQRIWARPEEVQSSNFSKRESETFWRQKLDRHLRNKERKAIGVGSHLVSGLSKFDNLCT